MTVTANWNVATVNGVQMLVINLAQFMVPLDWDPSSNMFLAVAAPNAAVQAAIGKGNFPALLKGDQGDTPNISTVINFTPLAYSDPTPDSASWTEIGSDQYQLNLVLHQGAPGEDGTMTILQAADFLGGATPGTLLVVNAAGTGVTTTSPLCGDRYVPAAIHGVPSGNAGYTLAPVTIPPQNSDWRPAIDGQSVITPAGSDCGVDLIARLSNSNEDGGETTGNDIGRAFGLSNGVPVNQVMSAGPPAGSGDAWDRVPAGQIATVFFRAERQTGGDYFTTSAATTRLGVRVQPCPTTVGAVQTSGGGSPTAGPLIVAITSAGAFSQAVPSWANYVDVVALGDGGGGGGGSAGAGHAGAGTSVTAGGSTLTAAGGAGGASGTSSGAGAAAGAGAGAYAYNGSTYAGGDSVAYQQAGAPPGGGGGAAEALGFYGYGAAAGVWESATYPVNGGTGVTSITGTVGAGGAAEGALGSAAGARGAVWLTFRQ